ncbi:hypothetical protein AB0K16_22085 [Nonomuraea jabiensis]|uniref:hypothetical protein n=1 Tax=Nonomuraea jabiensis TaxID=882448 RepID=UPI0034203259
MSEPILTAEEFALRLIDGHEEIYGRLTHSCWLIDIAFAITEIGPTTNPFTPNHDEQICMERLLRFLIAEKLVESYGYEPGYVAAVAAYEISNRLIQYCKDNPRKKG